MRRHCRLIREVRSAVTSGRSFALWCLQHGATLEDAIAQICWILGDHCLILQG